LFFYGALYEYSQKSCGWEIAYWTGSCNEEDLDANVRSTSAIFPRKGRPLMKGCLADLAIRGKKSYLAPRVTVYDDADDEGLTAIAQPLLVSGVAAKVALVALMARNTGLLCPQVDRVMPTVVEGFHAHL
ncbi:MAG: hypothetical protein Q8R28_12195, partial [Dehalococcoidia bacterium]|nr:hypothetical protein [Dehalococcoidia bacterium]